jgi:hypothetical protein
MFKSGQTSKHEVKKSGTRCHFKNTTKFKIGDGCPRKLGHVTIFGRGVMSQGRIVEEADHPRDATLQKNFDVMSPCRIVQGQIVYVPKKRIVARVGTKVLLPFFRESFHKIFVTKIRNFRGSFCEKETKAPP